MPEPRTPAPSTLRSVVRCACAGLYAGLITILSLLPSSTFPQPPDRLLGIDKAAHFAAYAVYAVLVGLAISGSRRTLKVVVWCSVHGLVMECLQELLLPNDRTFSLGDMLANLLGVLAGAGIAMLLTRRDRGGTTY